LRGKGHFFTDSSRAFAPQRRKTCPDGGPFAPPAQACGRPVNQYFTTAAQPTATPITLKKLFQPSR
jgi:hypothetical protein